MNITDSDFEIIIESITAYTGIIPRESHKSGIRSFLEKRCQELEEKEVTKNYVEYITSHNDEVINIINSSTVNETYLFREEKQFLFLRDIVFPELRHKLPPIKIWSAASSSGEEIYSLALLAKSCRIPAEYTASDINTDVLEKCKAGVYKKNSVRSVDGARFHYLLEPYKQKDGTFHMPVEISHFIKTEHINLADLAKGIIPENLPKQQHVIFIRNVFIYFSFEMRSKILEVLAEHCLADDGYLFVSMNEVASLENSCIPPTLKKRSHDTVFYFQKSNA
ncbi:MAG: hypothetical protein IIT68_03550 [Treponema sp.]|nr:hypothetical protein [Treponema sp.]